MMAALPAPAKPFLSVSQFAAREGVSRARVLQLLAADRIPAAQRAGHQWVIPAAAAIVRRPSGRPRKPQDPGAGALLRQLARKYVWWLARGEALKRRHLVISQVMELGDYDDAIRLESALGRDALRAVLREAEPGRFSARSWAYWHYRLKLARPGAVPPLPQRVIP